MNKYQGGACPSLKKPKGWQVVCSDPPVLNKNREVFITDKRGKFLGFLYRARSYDRVLCCDRVVICSRSLYQGFKLVISERNCPELLEAAEVTHESLELKKLG